MLFIETIKYNLFLVDIILYSKLVFRLSPAIIFLIPLSIYSRFPLTELDLSLMDFQIISS
jgi:hypothetical protein